MSIDHKATKIHGYDDKFFIEHTNEYNHFDVDAANEIFCKLKDMKQVFAHNVSFDFYHIMQEFKKLDLPFIT